MKIDDMQRRLAPVLRPAAAVYGGIMRLRAIRYRTKGLAFPYRAACPVVSVGNISWGGTGKTPIVDYLLDRTAKRRLRTVVLTRGYKAAPPELPFPVSNKDEPRHAGDEPLMLARRHPDTLVLVDPKRARAAAWAEKNAAPQLIFLDDGMQHLAIERDLDLVLLRPDDLLENWNRVIPAGTWRENKTALARADAFLMKADAQTLSSLLPVAAKRLKKFSRPFFSFDLKPTGLSRLQPFGKGAPHTTPDLDGKAYAFLCGTGNPTQVERTASVLLGRNPAQKLLFPDHHDYSETDAAKAAAFGLPVVCTAKDAVKLTPLLPCFGDTPVWVLDVRAVFGPSLFTPITFSEWWEQKLDYLTALKFT
ncbi:MAG: Tetraacyldisaccharide 4'-kinase [Desulfovibrio sp.]